MAGSNRALPIGVLISGAGTNLEAILQRCEAGTLAAEVRVVISNRPEAAGLEYSRRRGIPTYAVSRVEFPTRAEQQRRIAELLEAHGAELVVLAGFNQILNHDFVQRFSFRLINLHPSLMPAFCGGMHAVRDALAWGVKITGCTVHFIGTGYEAPDSGPIIVQRAVTVAEDDTEETLLARVHAAEYEALPAAIQLYAEGRLRVDGRRVRVLPPPADG